MSNELIIGIIITIVLAIFLFKIIKLSIKYYDYTYYVDNVEPEFYFDEVAKDPDYFKKTYGEDFFEWHTYKDWVKSGRKKRHR
jgi:hypothetical protein